MDDRDDEIAMLQAHNAELVTTVETLAHDNERLRAELPAPEYVPLKVAAADCNVVDETARAWCAAGLIEAYRQGGRWIVNVASLRARLTMLYPAT